MTPDIPRMQRAGVELLLGTDNAMINVPSMLREIEFAYRIARLKGDMSARDIVEMALRGRRLADPDAASAIRVGERADLVVLDVPDGASGFASLVRATASDVRLVVSGGHVWSGGDEPTPRKVSRSRHRR